MGQEEGNCSNASLYVGELSLDVTEEMILEKFRQFGPIMSIKVCRDKVTKESLGYAYVNFQNPADAERALDTMNYHPINGRQCRIMWCQPDPSLRRSGVGNIFIKNMDPAIDNKTLYDTFSAFGKVLSCKVMMNNDYSSSKGHGYVQFDSQESADLAIEKVDGMLIGEMKIQVGKFIPKKLNQGQGLDQRYTNVYVNNFGKDFDDDKLVSTFDKFGQIVSAVVAKDKAGKSRGFGYVNFKTHDAAAKAVEALNGSVINGHPIYCGPFQKKKERQKELMRKQWMPCEMQRMPCEMQRMPCEMQRMPREIQRMPREMQRMPREMQRMPREIQRMPREMPQNLMPMYPPYMYPGFQNQHAYFPPATTGMRPWHGGPVHYPYTPGMPHSSPPSVPFQTMPHSSPPSVPFRMGIVQQEHCSLNPQCIGAQQRIAQQQQPGTGCAANQSQYKISPSGHNPQAAQPPPSQGIDGFQSQHAYFPLATTEMRPWHGGPVHYSYTPGMPHSSLPSVPVRTMPQSSPTSVYFRTRILQQEQRSLNPQCIGAQQRIAQQQKPGTGCISPSAHNPQAAQPSPSQGRSQALDVSVPVHTTLKQHSPHHPGALGKRPTGQPQDTTLAQLPKAAPQEQKSVPVHTTLKQHSPHHPRALSKRCTGQPQDTMAQLPKAAPQEQKPVQTTSVQSSREDAVTTHKGPA